MEVGRRRDTSTQKLIHTQSMKIDVPIYDMMPDGWHVICGAQTAPSGYIWINNGVSPFSDEYRHALLKIKEQ